MTVYFWLISKTPNFFFDTFVWGPKRITRAPAQKESVGLKGRRRRGQRVRLLLCVCPFDSPLLFLSFFFFSNHLFFSGVNNRRPGRGRLARAAMAMSDETERDKAVTGPTRTATATQERQQVRMLLFFVIGLELLCALI